MGTPKDLQVSAVVFAKPQTSPSRVARGREISASLLYLDHL